MHHAPGYAARYPVEAATVHLVDIIAVAMALGSSGEYIVSSLVPETWECIGLPDSALSSVMAQTDRQFVGAVNAFYGN